MQVIPHYFQKHQVTVRPMHARILRELRLLQVVELALAIGMSVSTRQVERLWFLPGLLSFAPTPLALARMEGRHTAVAVVVVRMATLQSRQEQVSR